MVEGRGIINWSKNMVNKKLRIAQVSAIWKPTPPKLYGGTERVVSDLTETLVSRGHEVTLFASGDSKTKACLVPTVKRALVDNTNVPLTNVTFGIQHLHKAFSMHEEFDIIHVHLNFDIDFVALAFSDLLKAKCIFTYHFLQQIDPEKKTFHQDIFSYFGKQNFISISDSQRKIQGLNYIGTVYNGVNIKKYDFSDMGGNDAGWLGRFQNIKGPKEAIISSIGADTKLIMAGRYDKENPLIKEFYEREIKPYFDKYPNRLKYIGEVNDQQKNVFLGDLRCLINPINWEEPFGLVVPEANACGTPVVAFARGAMPELIKDGINGFLVQPGDINGLVEKIKFINMMNDSEYKKLRRASREYVENNFTTEIMTTNYENLYYKILENE